MTAPLFSSKLIRLRITFFNRLVFYSGPFVRMFTRRKPEFLLL